MRAEMSSLYTVYGLEGKLFHLSVSPFPHLCNEDNNSPHLTSLCELIFVKYLQQRGLVGGQQVLVEWMNVAKGSHHD